jgi:microcystin-dependent protein
MSDQYLGEIRTFPFNFAPEGWALCQGQLLSISQNSALFSLLGTQFGGNGTSNFGLPNLQGNVAVNAGNGAGLTPYVIGESAGSATVTLITNEIPAHSHVLVAQNGTGTSDSPADNLFAEPELSGRYPANMYSTAPPTAPMASSVLQNSGGNVPHNNLMPYLVINFSIALVGIYPSRS